MSINSLGDTKVEHKGMHALAHLYWNALGTSRDEAQILANIRKYCPMENEQKSSLPTFTSLSKHPWHKTTRTEKIDPETKHIQSKH